MPEPNWSFPTRDNTCPYCGHHTNTAGDESPKIDTRPPVAGDFSVCINCGDLAVFQPDLTLRKITAGEMATLHPDERRDILRTQRKVRAVNNRGRS